jgi:hypothetical protein
MKSTRLLRLIADAIAFTVLYVVGLWLVVSQGWLSHGTHLLQAQFAALGFSDRESAGLAADLGGALLQALTLGVAIFALGAFFRAWDQHRKRVMVARQAMSDYVRVLNTLTKLRKRIETPPYQGHEYLRHLLNELDRNVSRFQGRSTEFAGAVSVGAFRHFENVSNTMDNLLAFVDKVRNWNDGLNRDGPTHFWIDQALPTETLGHDKKVDTFLFMHRELMLFFSKLEVLPRKRNRNVINKAAEEFQEAREEFLKVRSAS